MATRKDNILVIEPDPTIRKNLAEGILEASGDYSTLTAPDGSEGLSLAVSYAPDLILMELEMPGLSGKDLMVALNSQGIETPVIVATNEGRESLAVEAFRLGAKDYLTKPYREAEVIATIERVLHEVRLRRERDELTNSLSEVNEALEQRLAEERTLFAVGKSVTSMTNLESLFSLIARAAVHLAHSDMSGVLVRDDNGGALILRAGEELPPHLHKQIGETINDDLAALIMTSGEPLLASGDGIKRRNVPYDAHSVIYVPMLVAEQAVGVLWVGNQESPDEFDEHQKDMLSALADYAAIAVVNASLFQVMDQRARRLEDANTQLRNQQSGSSAEMVDVSETVRAPLEQIRNDLRLLRTSEQRLNPQNEASLDVLDGRLGKVLSYLDDLGQEIEEDESEDE